MTMQTKLYQALTARYGKPAVDAALAERDVRWYRGVGCAFRKGWGQSPVTLLPDPVAVIVLCDVADRLGWAKGIVVEEIPIGCHNGGWLWRIIGKPDASGKCDDKPAAVLAALEAK
jgi:hypothetical protein